MVENKFVFVSYSSKDKYVADALCHYLEEHHIPCWIAPRDILVGQSWAGAIVKAIRNCSAMVLIYSAESNSSHQVANEIDKAFSYGKTIIPFIIDSTPMNDDLNYYLSRKHWLVAYPNYKVKFKPLSDSLIRIVSDLRNDTFTNAILTESIGIENSKEFIDIKNQYNKPKEDVKAWLCQKAYQGDVGSQYILGSRFYFGHGVPQNYTEAVRWYFKAAEQRYADAQYSLAVCYYNGHGVQKNYEEAIKWYREAISNGSVDAQYGLGICYYYGHGVTQSIEKAEIFFRIAAERGNSEAKDYIDKIKGKRKSILSKIFGYRQES